MSELIYRQAALDVLCDACGNCACPIGKIPRCSYYEKMQAIPAASTWHRVEEPPKYSGKVFVLMNREGPFYDVELVADTAMYNRLPRGPVSVGTFYKGMFGENDFEDITKNVLYWMPIELPEEE